MSEPRYQIELTDPQALRAYAHPLRMALVGLLRVHGPMTATQAAEQLGESVPSCSFHLRQLAKYGLAERVEGADGREKPWQATARFTSWATDSDDPEVIAAVSHLSLVSVSRHLDRVKQWYATDQAKEPPAWRKVLGTSDYLLYLTPDELAALEPEFERILSPYLSRLQNPGERPEGSRLVQLLQITTPREDLRP